MTPVIIGGATLYHGDCRDVLRTLADNSIDSIVTDPPYALVSIVKRFGGANAAPAKDGDVYARSSAGFMGKQWDTGETAFAVEFWQECLRVLKPGGHVLAFSGSRTYHRLAVAIEDAGFEIRDQIMWMYGSGFPKSHDVSKGIRKGKGKPGEDSSGNPIWCETCGEAPAEHNPAGIALLCRDCAADEWEGWGTALKPAHEPVVMARKPLIGPVVANVLAHGTGAINVDGCRVGDEILPAMTAGQAKLGTFDRGVMVTPERVGRWPANIIHDGSEEVLSGFPNDNARFFYCAKASKKDRDEGLGHMPSSAWPTMGNGIGGQPYQSKANNKNTHPTVKPTDLMAYLCRLITPLGGTILDPFMGSGSTGKAALREGFRFIGCEREDEYMPIAAARITAANDNTPPAKAGGGTAAAQPSFFDAA